MGNKLLGLDGIRACACLFILARHMFSAHTSTTDIFFVNQLQGISGSNFNVGVTIFFVLSGTLLSVPFWKAYFSGGSMPSIKKYFLRRAARILPAYYMALIVAFIVELVILPDSPYCLRRFLAGVCLLSGLHYTTTFPAYADIPLWSISYEVISYILLIFFMIIVFKLANKKNFQKMLFSWIICFLVVLGLNELVQEYCQLSNAENVGWEYGTLGGAKYWTPKYNPIGYFAQYLFGVLSAGIIVYFQLHRELIKKYQEKHIFDHIALLGIMTFLFLLVILSRFQEFELSFQSQPYHFPIFTGVVAIVITCLPFTKYVGVWMDNRFFSHIAKISFGIYVYHYIFGTLLFNSKGIGIPDDITEWWFVGVLMIILLSYVVATISWNKLEKPIIEKAKQIEKRWSDKKCVQYGQKLI